MAVVDEVRCQCDRCGQLGPVARDRLAARGVADQKGWQATWGDEMLCSECRLPPFSWSGDVRCVKCANDEAQLRWVPAYVPGHGGLGGCHDGSASKLERMCRTCSSCGYQWDEALPQVP
jgi:hypothetical protein